MISRKVVSVTASNHKKGKLSQAILLRRKNKLKDSLILLTELVVHYPQDPEINYQCAWAHDVLGREKEAIPYYEKSIDQGLEGKDLEGALIGLGSSYRCLGPFDKAIEILRRAKTKFPSSRAAQIFLAMALHNNGQHGQAMELLLKNLAETSGDPSISAYKKAILFYSSKMGNGGDSAVDDFIRSFNFARAMTREFINAVPEDKWDWSPTPQFAPFSKQLRHLICVQGVYSDGFLTKKADFSKKHSYYTGALKKDSLVEGLKNKTDRLKNILENFRRKETAVFKIDFFGTPMSFNEYCHVILQNESIHHGQWSLYAALAGFETPKSWQSNWDL